RGKGLFAVKLGVSACLIAAGLGLFVVALFVNPQGVPESVLTGIATGLFTTGLIEFVLSTMGARDRKKEMTRRRDLITPLDYGSEEGVLNLVLSNESGEVAIHVVVATNFSG